MIKSLIKSIVLCFVLAQEASAMAPAVSCSLHLCPWLDPGDLRAPQSQPSLVLKAFPSDGIENFMPVARHDDHGIPETVEGIWWMDFKQEGDILVTFATAAWDEETRTAKVPVYGERTYSFHATPTAAKSYAPLLATGYTYIVTFNEDYTKAEITPSLKVLGRRVEIPKLIAHFTMRYVGDGHWIRESRVLGHRLPDYDLKRVVRADGSRDPAYEDYLKVADEESYLAVPQETNP